MTEQDWDSGFGKCVVAFLNGQGISEVDPRGERVTDDSFLLCLNAHYEDIEVTLPGEEYGSRWGIVIDTTWDTNADASEFADAATTAINKLPDPARVSSPAGPTVTVLIASDQQALLALDVIFGATGV